MKTSTRSNLFSLILLVLLIANYQITVESFLSQSAQSIANWKIKESKTIFRFDVSRKGSKNNDHNKNENKDTKKSGLNRRNHLQKVIATCGLVSTGLISLPERAIAIEDEQSLSEESVSTNNATPITESIYDFDVMYNKEVFPLERYKKGTKAAIVTSIKLDDPYMLQNMPGLIDAYNNYGKDGLKVFLFPTEQGAYEGDVDKDIRIKMYQQYQFGQFPNAVIFDRLNVVGKTADPLYRYLSRTCKNGNGVGRITLNFEKFLIDSNGVPVRRYPRKYPVEAMQDDIEAVLDDKPLPPAPLAWYKAWKDAIYEADRGEYSFRRGLNYY